MPKPLTGETSSVVSIQLDSETNVKADEIYFVYIPKEGEDRGVFHGVHRTEVPVVAVP